MIFDEMVKLRDWYVRDLQKPEVDKFERATIIRSAINDSGMSVRGFAEKYKIPRGTVDDWLLYNRISEQEYNRIVASGVNPKSVYKALRENKKQPLVTGSIDVLLLEFKLRLRAIKNSDYTPKTPELIEALINDLNSLHSRIIVSSKKQRGAGRK